MPHTAVSLAELLFWLVPAAILWTILYLRITAPARIARRRARRLNRTNA